MFFCEKSEIYNTRVYFTWERLHTSLFLLGVFVESIIILEDGKIIKCQNEVEYLNVKINKDGNYDEEIKAETRKGNMQYQH